MKRSAIPLVLLGAFLLASSAGAVTAPRADAAAGRETAAPTYRVKAGDSLSTIARRHGLPVKELKSLNGLSGDLLKPDQVLIVGSEGASPPGSSSGHAAAGPAAPKGRQAAPTWRVGRGDTLYAIARRHGVSVEKLKQLNGLKSDRLKPGQKLVLGPPAISPPPAKIATGPDPGELLRREAANPQRQEGNPFPSLFPGGGESAGALEEVAFAYLSTPYRFGGTSRQGIDCSSFVQSVFRELDIDLPRTAREQYQMGDKVGTEGLRSGDLLFFRTYARYPSHVGIYLGDQKMIHASPRSRRVVITDLNTPYFRSRFIGARRLALLERHLDLDALTRGIEEESDSTPAGGAPEPAKGEGGQTH